MGNDFKFLKGNIETIILNALYNGDKYGYEITKEIKEKTENQYEIKQPTLYGYLKRLEEQNLVEPYWGEESHGGRRKYFRLTAHGKKTCEQYLSEWNFHRNILDSLIAEPTETLPEYTPQENMFLGSKESRKRKSKKDFRDESENQQLFAELMKLSQQSPEDKILDEEKIDEIIADDSIFMPDNDSATVVEDNSFEQQLVQFEDQIVVEKDVLSADYATTEESIPIISAYPIIERKSGDVAETTITNEISYVEIDQQQETHEELLRISDCDEKFAPPQHISQEIVDSQEQKAAYLNNIISHNIAEEKVISPQPVAEEKESEAQYKQILGNLLGDQIINTDEKVAQISPQLANYRDEFTSENLTMAEMADSLAKEGYRIRFYNTATSQYRAVPMLIKNKINCITAWSTLVIFYALLGFSWLICGNSVSVLGVCLTAFAVLLIPVYFTYVYITKPNIRIKPTHDFKHSIISKAIIFIFATALLITIGLLLLKIDFTNSADVMHKFIIPELLLMMIVVSEVVYNVFSKQKTFYS